MKAKTVLTYLLKPFAWISPRKSRAPERSFNCPASKICSVGRSNSHLHVLLSEHVGESGNLTQLLINERRSHDRFIGNLSFDLRSRLHNMLGLLSLAAETESRLSDPALLRLLQREFDGLMSVSDRIGALLAGMDPNEQSVRPLTLSALCDAQIGQRFQALTEARTEIVATYSREIPANLIGDVERTEHLLGCVLDVCMDKFEDGKLHLDVSLRPGAGSKRRVRFSLKFVPQGSTRSDRVCDNSFEEQSRAARIGMNMVIAERIADQLGGVFHWQGTGDRIAELSFELPFTVPLRRDQAGVPPSTNGNHSLKLEFVGSTVLVADDDAIARKIAEHLLTQLGFSVTTVDDGAGAVSTAECAVFDFILLDCKMPGIDGLEAAKRIRALPGHAEVIIIGMTAQILAGDRESCLEAGMNEVLAKPFAERELVSTLRKFLTKSGAVSVGQN